MFVCMFIYIYIYIYIYMSSYTLCLLNGSYSHTLFKKIWVYNTDMIYDMIRYMIYDMIYMIYDI